VVARDGSLSGRRQRSVVAAGDWRPATLGAVRSPKRGALDEMVAQATVDCYNDSECVTGFYTMLDEHLDMPFQATVLGVDVTVTGIDLTDDDQIVAICARGRSRQRIPIVGLPLPTPLPEGAEWIEAYRHWRP
jgi:Calcium binding